MSGNSELLNKIKALEEENKRLQDMLNYVPDIYFILDREGYYLDFKGSNSIRTLVSPDFFLGKTFYEVLPKEIIEINDKYFTELLRTNKEQIYTYSLIGDGKEEWYEARLIPTNDKKVIGIVSKVTEKVKSKVKFKKQSELLESILDSLTYPFYVVNADDYTVELYNKASGFMGKEDQKCYEGSHGEYSPCCQNEQTCPIKIIKKTKKPTKVIHDHYNADGKEIKVEVNAFPVFDEKGNITKIIEYSIDVTERFNARKKLEINEKKYRYLFDATSDPVILFNEYLEIIEFNKATEVVFGYKNDEVKGLSVFDLIHPQWHSHLKDIRDKLEDSGKNMTFESSCIRKNGSIFPTELRILPAKLENKVLFYLNFHDISQRISRERELMITKESALQAKNVAEEANKAKSSFLANITHEIRTPLNSIIGFSDILHDDENDSERKEMLNLIRNSGKNLLNMINDIIDYSKVDLGNISIEKKPFSLKNLLLNIRELYKLKAEEKNLSFNLIMESNLHETINSDRLRINQILLYLLSNSFKFTEKGGVVLKAGFEGSNLVLSVTDTGIGIEKSKLKTIFNPFDQIDSSLIKKYGGTGLGLAITKKIVTLLGGSIEVESTVGYGSTFTVKIPLSYKDVVRNKHNVEVDGNNMVLGWINSGDDDSFYQDILMKGIKKLPHRLNLIQNAWRNKDLVKLKELVHELKGMSGNLSMTEVYDLTKALDLHLLQNNIDFDTCDNILSKLNKIINNVPDDYLNEEEEDDERDFSKANDKLGNLLVAEDNEVNMKLIELLCNKFDYNIDKAENGKEVLEKLKKNSNYDAILLDINMPILDGIETLEIIRKNTQYDEVVVAALSATSPLDENKFLELGFDFFISKPIRRSEFGNIMKKLMDLRNKRLSSFDSSEWSKEDIEELDLLIKNIEKNIEIFDSEDLHKIAKQMIKLKKIPEIMNLSKEIDSIAESFDDDRVVSFVKKIKEFRKQL